MELVGRENELTEVTERLRQRRLVTITGPGGVGKTRLAKEAAAIVGPEFEYGAVSIDLTRVDQPQGVAEAVAGQLGYADFESLMNSPSDQPALIVIDNCEHVLDAAADATDRMLQACQMPTILTTSRSPLDLADESVFTLGPLDTPPPDGEEAGAPSVHLFLARAADHRTPLDDDDLALVAEICRQLDGVPLAIEIAAARLRSSSLNELLEDMGSQPHALSRPRFRGKRSHRSVADMVGWSFDLLDDPERDLFVRLGIFSGPFTAPMAHAVALPSHDEPAITRDRLAELVGGSLVVADTAGEVTWYRLLHPVRAVALDQLREIGELPGAQSRLVDHVVTLALGVISQSTTGWGGSVLNDLLALYDNIAASLRWTLDNDDDPGRSLILLAVLWGVVHQSHTAEIGSIGEAVLNKWNDPATPGWADAAATVATCRNLLGNPEGAVALATDTLPYAHSSPFAPATLRRVLAQTNRAMGDLEAARDWFAEGAQAAADTAVHGIAMELAVDHAVVVAELGQIDLALELLDVITAEADTRGARINHAWALAGRGAILLRRSAGEAEPAISAAVDAARAISYPAGLSFSLRALATARFQLGDLPGSASALLDLIDELLQRGGLNDLRMALDTAALILEATDAPAWADLAVTAAALPVTSVGTAVDHDVFDRASELGTVLSVRDAYVTARRELGRVANRGDLQPPEPVAESEGPSFIREGEFWRLRFDGASISMKPSKGLADLAVLLAEPGREFTALDLAGVDTGHSSEPEILDSTARRNYEERARDLQLEIEEADEANDIGRADQLRVEFDALVEQLTAAAGLSGRSRRVSGDSERARSAVTQRIRATVKRIASQHATLGAHLQASITTGTFCSYRPPTTTTWTIAR